MTKFSFTKADWLRVGIETGWYQKQLRRVADTLGTLKTMVGNNPLIGTDYLARMMQETEMARGLPPSNKAVWFEGFLARITSVQNNISADLKALDSLASKDQRMTGVATELRQMQGQIQNNFLPIIKNLQTQMSTEMAQGKSMQGGASTTTQEENMNVPMAGHEAIGTM